MKFWLALVALVALYWWWQSRRPRRRPDPLAEARRVLGVGPDADADTIRAAHRRLSAGVHPDRGGSTELAGRVNAARDLLLRQLR